MLDTTHTIETPEGVELQLRIAGPIVRILAWAIDFGIRSIGYFLLGLLLIKTMIELGTGLFLIAVFLLEWFYPILFEVYRQGATPGKKIMKIKVLHELGTPVDWSASMIRNLLRAVDFLPLFYGFGLITMLMNKDFKRIGDLAAGTIVVYQDDATEYLALPKAQPLAAPYPLTLEEQRAIIHFAERAQTLSPERVIELANLVTPLTGEIGTPAVQVLYQMANGLAGQTAPHETKHL
jgi:uncharacterized RDD family membrane protein YckC